ncbi:hypothetical protein C485_17172 [Natrinema altunense JCM 12890]|uniref:Uncharacterized protein n=1 Tax=Natrinema altunense (strain JCM 12890 / CGMCC 1.3731 / AJ2) TaxID=1227494 RepID=L9ZAM0_NATA2|nr:hypothetical protein C485_17172 [Natrinema altunense JCM 12890]
MLFSFDDGKRTFSAEYVNFEDPPFRGFNIAGTLPGDVHGQDVADAVSLGATDVSSDFIVLESGADDAAARYSRLRTARNGPSRRASRRRRFLWTG